MELAIPNKGLYDFRYLLLDYNGTLATDGEISEQALQRLDGLSESFEIYILSADTHGTLREKLKGKPYEVRVVSSDQGQKEKGDFVEGLGAQHVIAIGNGNIDIQMFEKAALSIGIMGKEGIATKAILHTDLIVGHIEEALDLLLYPKRLIATLR